MSFVPKDVDSKVLRESARRVSTTHQRVVLDLDFSANISGYTELTILPLDQDLRTINLHCRQCIIEKVTVGGIVTEFIHQDPLASISVTDPTNPKVYPEVKRKLYSALTEGDEGELSIAVPKEVSVKSAPAPAGTPVSAGPTAETFESKPSPFEAESTLVVKIEYRLRHPIEGVNFVLSTEHYPYRVPHVYTTPSCPDAARCWVPCIDNMWERCTWEFEFIVPRYLTAEEDVDMDRKAEDIPVVVVCSGDFKEQVAHPYNSHKTLWFYRQDVLTTVQHIAFAAGPFHVMRLGEDKADEQAEGDESQDPRYPMHAFCLPGLEASLKTSTSFLPSAMSFFVTEFGAYPFSSYNLVFVDDLPRQRSDNACLSLVSNDLLHGEDAIDQVYETRQSLSHALAVQWAGINIIQKLWSDTWLINGLGLYITGLYLRKLFGNNEYRFRMKMDMTTVCSMDIGAMPPICQPGTYEPPDASALRFINIKASVVLHVLDRHLGKSGTSLGLSRVLPKIFLSSMTGELTNNTLSTHSFLRTCRKVSGVDPKAFADRWIYASGCPTLSITASFNRKKMSVDITITQECPAYTANEGDPVALALLKPVQSFEGPITFRIHEADGTPYEHVLNVAGQFKKYEVPFNTKYKRIRRHTKRYIARQAAAAAAADGDQEAAEAMGSVDMGFGLALWEDEAVRAQWRVRDWTEEEERAMESSTYEWIRVDADFEWIATILFDQPDFMWASQLQRDRDVVAQLQAVHALSRMPSAVVSSILTKTVLVENYFFRIRQEAALALQTCGGELLEFIGLFHLFKIFADYCYKPDEPGSDPSFRERFIPKPNDFTNFAQYFVRKSVFTAISRCRTNENKTWNVARRLYIDVLQYNDNSKNAYSDARYLSSAIVSLATVLLPPAPPERGLLSETEAAPPLSEEDAQILREAIDAVDRYRLLDQIVPSQHNVLTIASLEFYLAMMLSNLTPVDPGLFLGYTKEGNYTPVRLCGFDALLLMKWYTNKALISYLFYVVRHDSCRIVRRHLARGMCESLAVLYCTGELEGPDSQREPILIEEDVVGSKKKSSKHGEIRAMDRSLRKVVGRGLREWLMPVMLDVNVDHEVRWCMIKLADLILKPDEEPMPSVKLIIPATPVSEFPPPFPTPLSAAPVSAVSRVKSVKVAALQSPSVPDAGPSLHRTEPSSVPVADFSARDGRGGPWAMSEPVSVPPSRPAVSSSKKKKEGPDVEAQPARMSTRDYKACEQAYNKLVAHKHSVLFRYPVDPIRDHAPDYLNRIKFPMDLSLMNNKLTRGEYRNRFEFEEDFRLMIANAHSYNAPGTYARSEADLLNSFFEKQWARINKTLEGFDRGGAEAVTAVSDSVAVPAGPQAELPAVKASQAGAAKKGKGAVRADSSTSALLPIKIKPILKPSTRPEPATQAVPPLAASTPAEAIFQLKPTPSKPKASKVKVIPQPAEAPKQSKKRPADDLLDALLNEEVDAIEAERRPSKKPKKGDKSRGTSLDDDVLAALERTPSPAPVATTGSSSKTKAKDKAKPATDPSAISTHGQAPPPSLLLESETPSSSKRQSSAVPKGSNDPINVKKCREVLKTIRKLDQAIIFNEPVNPERDGCPTYYDEIKHPMDFGTMEANLSTGKYKTMGDFAGDFDLVISNCRKFNPPTTVPVQYADVVEKVFQKEWSKALIKKLSKTDKKGLQSMLTKVQGMQSAFLLLVPVDPIALGIPTYHQVIKPENCRDLSMIKAKLDGDKYDSFEALDADVRLMIDNAITFNGAESEVGVIVRGFEKEYNAASKPFRSQQGSSSKGKRKEPDDKGATQGQPKKKKTA